MFNFKKELVLINYFFNGNDRIIFLGGVNLEDCINYMFFLSVIGRKYRVIVVWEDLSFFRGLFYYCFFEVIFNVFCKLLFIDIDRSFFSKYVVCFFKKLFLWLIIRGKNYYIF